MNLQLRYLTHYHPDYVDALNEILADTQDLLVGDIYVSPIDYDRYIAEAKPWDGPEWLVDSDDYRAKPLIKHFSEKGT